MAKVYDTLNEHYPELNEVCAEPVTLSDSSIINEVKESSKKNENNNQVNVKDSTSDTSNLDSAKIKFIRERISQVSQEFETKSFENNKWIRSLNKIILALVSEYKNTGAAFLFAGATRKVGASTVSYWAARLLASFNYKHRTLYITLSLQEKKKKLDIFDDLSEKIYTEKELAASLGQSNFNHFTLNIANSNINSPSTPRYMAEIISEARSHYNWIVIDAPPLVEIPAMYTLACDTDGVILVARAQKTRVPTLNAVSKDLDECGAKLQGVILNHRVFPLPRFLMRFF